ncbi:MAG TPA: 2OG-Fe(II) oxygenase, partial [Allosphingosinicella sp.]
MYRAEIGAWVKHRLQNNPAALKLPSSNLDIFVVRSFLTEQECKRLCARIDKQRQPSGILGDFPDPEFRTSESCNLDPHEPLARAVESKITKLMGIEPIHGET